MKTKLSFLVLPLCLGMVVALVLAACGGESSPSGPQSGASSSGGYTPMSSDVTSSQVTISDNFGVELDYEIVRITGTIQAAKVDPLVKVEFRVNGSGWVSYKGNPVTGAITFPVSDSVTLVRLSDAEIDLNNPSIPCSTLLTIQVVAYPASGEDNRGSKSGTFEKPAYMCAISSSGTEASSSSEAVWKFEAPHFEDVILNSAVNIGSGSFKLTGDDDAQPDIEVTGGAIRRAESIGGDDDVIPGKAYSVKNLGSVVPSDTKEVLQNQEYYLIYLNNGDKYLLQFTKREGASWSSWPKKCTYWKATESP